MSRKKKSLGRGFLIYFFFHFFFFGLFLDPLNDKFVLNKKKTKKIFSAPPPPPTTSPLPTGYSLPAHPSHLYPCMNVINTERGRRMGYVMENLGILT